MLAVGACVDGGGRDAWHDVAGAFADETEHIEFRDHALHHGKDRLIQGHVHHLALAAIDFPVAQRHQRADHPPQGGNRVPDGNPGAHRRAVIETGDVAQAAHRLAYGTEAWLVFHRPGLAKARQAHHHQARVQRMQHIPPQTKFFQHARAKVFDQDVGLGQQALEDIAALGVLEVEGERLLVAGLHEPPQRGALVQLAPLAQRVAAIGRFDLDHFGAEFGTDTRGERPGDQGTEFDNFKAGEGFAGRRHGVSVAVGQSRGFITRRFRRVLLRGMEGADGVDCATFFCTKPVDHGPAVHHLQVRIESHRP
ncbi:hypothetical protein D3C76_740890 [compost metagenome]